MDHALFHEEEMPGVSGSQADPTVEEAKIAHPPYFRV